METVSTAQRQRDSDRENDEMEQLLELASAAQPTDNISLTVSDLQDQSNEGDCWTAFGSQDVWGTPPGLGKDNRGFSYLDI